MNSAWVSIGDGTSSYFLFDRRPYLEDWATLFKLLEERKIEPVIMRKFAILEADQANELRRAWTALRSRLRLLLRQATGRFLLIIPASGYR
jgi:hypothetical protein